MLSIICCFYNFKYNLPTGGKGVRGEFRPSGSGSGSSSPFWLELGVICFGFEFEFLVKFCRAPLHFSGNRFEQGEQCSISQYLFPQVRVPVEVFANLLPLNLPFYLVISAIVPAVSKQLFFPVVGGSWERSSQNRIRRLFKNLQNLLSNFFYVPLRRNTKLVNPAFREGRKTRAFTTHNMLEVVLSKGLNFYY